MQSENIDYPVLQYKFYSISLKQFVIIKLLTVQC